MKGWAEDERGERFKQAAPQRCYLLTANGWTETAPCEATPGFPVSALSLLTRKRGSSLDLRVQTANEGSSEKELKCSAKNESFVSPARQLNSTEIRKLQTRFHFLSCTLLGSSATRGSHSVFCLSSFLPLETEMQISRRSSQAGGGLSAAASEISGVKPLIYWRTLRNQTKARWAPLSGSRFSRFSRFSRNLQHPFLLPPSSRPQPFI